jgi:hypothetical protein
MNCAALIAVIALSGCGGYRPAFSDYEAELAVGETQTLSVIARCQPTLYGACASPYFGWHFESEDVAIATAEVIVDAESREPTPFDVTGIAPGRTTIFAPGHQRDLERNERFVRIKVYCASEPPVQAETAHIHAHIGESVDLIAVSPIAYRMVFAWYEGRSGDSSRPLNAGGDTFRFTPAERGTRYVWVHASTPCSTSSAEFRIDSDVPKRRAVRSGRP